MTDRDQLIAYLATLLALVIVFLGAMVIAALVPSVMGKIELFGLGTVTGGLLGVLSRPTTRAPTATTDSGDVNVTAPAPAPLPDAAAGQASGTGTPA